MSASPPLSAMPQQQQQQQQHHYHHSWRLQEQQEQQNCHFQRLEQYRQHPILPSQSHTYGHHPHPYHPYHSYHNVYSPQHQQQSYSSSLLPPLPTERQTSPVDLPSSSQQDSAFFSPTPLWQQQRSSSSVPPSLQQLLFDENSVPFEGFSVPPEYAWDSLVDSGSNLLAASTGPDLFPAGLDTSDYFFSTPDLSATQHGNAAAAVAVAGSANQPTTLSSRRAVSEPQRQSSLKLRVDRRINMYRGLEKQNAGQPIDTKLQTIMPLHPSELYGSSSPSAPPLSPLGKVDTNGIQSSLAQSLANLTTSSPNLACLSPPTFSSPFGQNPVNFPDSQRSVLISSDHLSGLYAQSDEGINNNNKDQDNDDHNDNNDNYSKAAAEEEDESDRRFQCPICPKRFLRQYNLNAHLKTHSQVRAHACTQCDKSFLRPYDLSRHQRIHSNSKPYTCNICQLIFIRNDAIWRHYRRAHLGHPDVPPARRQRRPQRI
ncbi:hypothetical protein BG015_003729, partial [Linnemannia schmuckeri]